MFVRLVRPFVIDSTRNGVSTSSGGRVASTTTAAASTTATTSEQHPEWWIVPVLSQAPQRVPADVEPFGGRAVLPKLPTAAEHGSNVVVRAVVPALQHRRFLFQPEEGHLSLPLATHVSRPQQAAALAGSRTEAAAERACGQSGKGRLSFPERWRCKIATTKRHEYVLGGGFLFLRP